MSDEIRWYWVPDPSLVYCAARVTSESASGVTLARFEDGGGGGGGVPGGDEVHLSADVFAREASHALASTLHRDLDNLVHLEELGEGAILHQLRTRYGVDKIYTAVGGILVSVNPYKLLPIYSSATLQRYYDQGPGGGGGGAVAAAAASAEETSDALPPHVFQIAADALFGLRGEQKSQSVVISGESGAGKTEATKLIVQFLSEVAGSASSVEEEILQSSPVLEAFGNAKTVRNNNSSRFGKWMEIHFDPAGQSIVGAKVVNYLLEKSRLVQQSQGERNYHIFYQLCTGADPDTHSKYALASPEAFSFLNQSGCYTVENHNDADEFRTVLGALRRLRFDDAEIDGIWGVLAAILHLGNVALQPDPKDDEHTVVNPNDRDALEHAARILHVDADVLDKALCFRTVVVVRDVSYVPLTLDQAREGRDAMCKAIYSRLFDWLVHRINVALGQGAEASGKMCIGVLDIFGFEIFDVNRLSQFFINFANEKLQQHFNNHVFKMEQDEYAAEHVDVQYVDFEDNGPCIDLIEGRAGIIGMIGEETRLPKGSDDSLVTKMHQQFAKHDMYSQIRSRPDSFTVHHYAGKVTYDVAGFVDTSRDKLHDSQLELCMDAQQPVMRAVFEAERQKKAEAAAAGGGGGRRRGKKGAQHLGGQFKKQLGDLMGTLSRTASHFVRCVKPNTQKVPDLFTSQMVLEQLRYSGLFSAIRIRQSGYPYRKPASDFLNRFRVCLTLPALQQAGDPAALAAALAKGQAASTPAQCKAACQAMMAAILDSGILGLERDGNWYQVGDTKVFCRHKLRVALETLRDQALERSVVLIQTMVRGFLERARYKVLRQVAQRVRAAAAARDVETVGAALAFVEEMTAAHGEDCFDIIIDEVEQLEELHEQIVEELRVIRLIKRALNKDAPDAEPQTEFESDAEDANEGMGQLAMIQAALERSSHIKLEQHRAGDAEVSALIAEARTKMESLLRRAQARKQLADALVHCTIPELEAALAEGRAMGFDQTTEVGGTEYDVMLLNAARADFDRAVMLLEELQNEAELFAEVKTAKERLHQAAHSDPGKKSLMALVEGVRVALESVADAQHVDKQRADLLRDAKSETVSAVELHVAALIAADHESDIEALLEGELTTHDELADAKDDARAYLQRKADEREERRRAEEAARIAQLQAEEAEAARRAEQERQAKLDQERREREARERKEREARDARERHEKEEAVSALAQAAAEEEARAAASDAAAKATERSAHHRTLTRGRSSLRLMMARQQSEAALSIAEDGAVESLNSAIDSRDLNVLSDLTSSASDQSLPGQSGSLLRRARRLQERLSDAERVEHGLRDAIRALDRSAMRGLLNESVALGLDETQLMKEARYLCFTISEADFMAKRLLAAQEANDAVRLEQLLAEAARNGIHTAEVDSAQDVLHSLRFEDDDIPPPPPMLDDDDDFAPPPPPLMSDGSAASLPGLHGALPPPPPSEDGDTPGPPPMRRLPSRGRARAITSTGVDVQEYQQFLQTRNKYPFNKFKLLRREGNYAKRNYLNKRDLKRRRLLHQTDDIPRSLFKLSTAYCGGRNRSKELKKQAMSIFTSLLRISGDRFHQFPEALLLELLETGAKEELLRDEIYCQLMKQTTQNPNPEANQRYWKVMYLCLCYFPPSRQLSPYLLAHLAKYARREFEPIAIIGFSSVSDLATHCFAAWNQRFGAALGGKYEPGSVYAHQFLEKRLPPAPEVKAFLSGGRGRDDKVSWSMQRQRAVTLAQNVIFCSATMDELVSANKRKRSNIAAMLAEERIGDTGADSDDDDDFGVVQHSGSARSLVSDGPPPPPSRQDSSVSIPPPPPNRQDSTRSIPPPPNRQDSNVSVSLPPPPDMRDANVSVALPPPPPPEPAKPTPAVPDSRASVSVSVSVSLPPPPAPPRDGMPVSGAAAVGVASIAPPPPPPGAGDVPPPPPGAGSRSKNRTDLLSRLANKKSAAEAGKSLAARLRGRVFEASPLSPTNSSASAASADSVPPPPSHGRTDSEMLPPPPPPGAD